MASHENVSAFVIFIFSQTISRQKIGSEVLTIQNQKYKKIIAEQESKIASMVEQIRKLSERVSIVPKTQQKIVPTSNQISIRKEGFSASSDKNITGELLAKKLEN